MSFVIEKQESLAQVTFTKNGVIKDLHLVAKNISFTIHVKSEFNLNGAPISAKLYYDFDDGEKEPREVETLKVTPLEYTSHVNESGDRAAFELRIGVLSSQHEGAYFRVKLSATDTTTNKTFHVFSQPIKIISKRTQVKKILEKFQQPQPQVSSPQSSPLPSFETTSPVRTSNEALALAIRKLEEQQREQSHLLKELCGRVTQPVSQTISDPSESDFETAFKNFVLAYSKLPVEERPKKLRKVLKNDQEITTRANDFIDLYCSEGFHPLRSSPTEHFEHIDEICPYKKELERMDTFYNEFLAEPLVPETL